MDPLAEVNPDWNPYRYGFNNPLTYTDPTGMIEGHGLGGVNRSRQAAEDAFNQGMDGSRNNDEDSNNQDPPSKKYNIWEKAFAGFINLCEKFGSNLNQKRGNLDAKFEQNVMTGFEEFGSIGLDLFMLRTLTKSSGGRQRKSNNNSILDDIDVTATKGGFGSMMEAGEAARYAKYWQSYAPKQISPGTTRMDWLRMSGRTGRMESSRVIYDNFGRQIYRVDFSNHMRPLNHSVPHLHQYQYGPMSSFGKESVFNFFGK